MQQKYISLYLPLEDSLIAQLFKPFYSWSETCLNYMKTFKHGVPIAIPFRLIEYSAECYTKKLSFPHEGLEIKPLNYEEYILLCFKRRI